MIVMPVAESGPLFVAVIAKATVSLTFKVERFATIVTARSARFGVTTTESRSLAVMPSPRSLAEIHAASTSVVPAVAGSSTALSSSAAAPPLITLPTLHAPVAGT